MDAVPITMFISMAVIIISFFFFSHKNKKATLKTIEKAVENGTNLTPELLDKLSNSKAARPARFKDMRRGVILVALGVAGLVASAMFTDEEPSEVFRILSMLPLFIGAGFLLVWKLNKYED